MSSNVDAWDDPERGATAEASDLAEDAFPLVGRCRIERCTVDMAEAKRRFREAQIDADDCDDEDSPPRAEVVQSFRKTPLPAWLVEIAWESDDYPIDDSPEAICQWLSLVEKVCRAMLNRERETNTDLRKEVEAFLNDANRLVYHLKKKTGVSGAPNLPANPTVGMTLTYLLEVRDWVERNRTVTNTPDGVTWQNTAEKLERLRSQGESFQSYRKYAELFGCSTSTIKKAIDNTQTLHSWARPAKASAPKAQSLNEVVTDNISQRREPDPTGILEEKDVDAAMQYLIDQAEPEERARIYGMSDADRRKLAELAYSDPDRADRILDRKA